MVVVFSTPILSIAADAIRDLEGHDALPSLWTIFTKCKGSLQNGPRLENITWRLWHREFRSVDREKTKPLEKENTVLETNTSLEKSGYFPPTPSETLGFFQPPSDIAKPSFLNAHTSTSQGATVTSEPHHPPSYSPSPLLSPSTQQVPRPSITFRNSLVTGNPRSVGQIICDLLPVPTAPRSQTKTSYPELSERPLISSSEMLPRPSAEDASFTKSDRSIHTSTIPASSVVRPRNLSLSQPSVTVLQNTISCLPTPEIERDELGHRSVCSLPSQTPSLVASASNIPELSLSIVPDCSSKFCEVIAPSPIHSVVNLDTLPSLSGQFAATSVDSGAIHQAVEATALPSHLLHLPQSSTADVTIRSPPKDSLIVPRTVNQLLVEAPRLVVVDPTPNPTPHPTPPTTPHLSGGGRPQWLSPPIRASSRPRVPTKSVSAMKEAPPLNSNFNSLMHDPSLIHPKGVEGFLTQNNSKGDAIIPPHLSSLGVQPLPQQALIRGRYESASARDALDGNSVSSITSSDCSHASTMTSNLSSTATGSTTSASSNGDMDDEEKADEFDVKPGHFNVPRSTITLLGSPSTIKSISTDHAWKGAENVDDDEHLIEGEVVNTGEHLVLTSNPQSSSSAKHLKRNSAPLPLTSSAILTLSPTHTPGVHQSSENFIQLLSPKSAMTSDSTSDAGEVVDNNTREGKHSTSGSDRSTSQPRSGKGSGKGSPSRSRDHTAAADLSGLGTLGGYTIAAAYPPPSMMVRKQVAVGAGKGKVKVAIRGLSGKARPTRRHSAGPGLDIAGKAKEREAETAGTKTERVKASHSGQQAEACVEQHQPPSMQQGLPLITEEKAPQGATTVRTDNLKGKLLPDMPVSEHHLKRPRFNIGSNSDEGSGLGSKSAGSESSVSVGPSIDQRVKTLMDSEGVLSGRMDVQGLDKQLERQRILEGVREIGHQSNEQNRNPQTGQGHCASFVCSPARQSEKQDYRSRKKHTQQAASRKGSAPRTPTDDNPSSGWMTQKATGKLKALDPTPTTPPGPQSSKQTSKSKSKSTPNLGGLDPVLAAKVRDSLADPLLPKGRPVVVATESEDETDTEDGSWSSEDMSDQAQTKQEQFKRESALQQEREKQEEERQQRELLLRKMYVQQQQQHRPAGLQRTHSSNYPAAGNARNGKAAAQRSRQQQQREVALHHAKLEQAAREAQRQRDMIKKLPTESLQDLAKARANSVGLLSQLLKPNPEIFPPNHPYRRGASSGAIQSLGLTPMVPMQSTTSEPGPVAPIPGAQPGHKSSAAVPDTNPPITEAHPKGTDSKPPLAPHRHGSSNELRKRVSSLLGPSPPIRGLPKQPTKTAIALPISSQVQVGSITAKGAPSVAVTTEVMTDNLPATGYRLKGRPKDQELEEDSGSEPETGKIQVPKSVAEQKLKALVQRRGVKQNQIAAQDQAGPSKQAPQVDDELSVWSRVPQPPNLQHQRRFSHGLQFTRLSRPTPTAPIPLGHPYNLPHPDPPTSPRTTRRQMLSTELSESLRRNLLWERQVSKNNVAGMKRSSSGVVSRDGKQPFIGMPRVVQLHAKGTIPPDQQDDPTNRVLSDENERAEMRRHAMARNRSWANDFHYSGW